MKKQFRCRYCGTIWKYDTRGDRSVSSGGVSGFIVARIRVHIEQCGHRTIEERRKWLQRAMKRKRTALHSEMIFDPTLLDRLADEVKP